MKKERGFTLIEGIVTLLIVFIILGVSCLLLTEYTNVLNFSGGKTSALTNMQVAQQQMLDDLRQATLVKSPVSGGSSFDLRFQRIDPAQAWLPRTPPPPPPPPLVATWILYASSTLIEIHYYLVDGNLMREAGPVSAPPTNSWLVAQAIAGLQVTALGEGAYQIQLSLLESQRIQVLTGTSMRPVL